MKARTRERIGQNEKRRRRYRPMSQGTRPYRQPVAASQTVGLFIHAVSARPTGEATALHAYQLDTRSVDQVGLAFSLILTAANLGSGGAVSYQSSAKI